MSIGNQAEGWPHIDPHPANEHDPRVQRNMSSSSRLHLQYPHVAALLEHFSRDRQSALADAAAVLACEMAGVSPPARQASVLETLVQTMDETAWDLQDTDSSD